MTRRLHQLSLPLIAAVTAGAANSLANSIILARHSEIALRACQPSAAFAGIITSVAITFLGYSGTIVANFDGSGQQRLAVHTFVQGLWLFFFSLPVFAMAIPFSWLVLGSFGHTAELLAAERMYVTLLLGAGALQALSTVAAGFFTGRGRTKFPGTMLTLGFLANITITPLFVFCLDLGIAGAGLAAILAQSIPCVILIASAARDELVARSLSQLGVWRFMPGLCREIFRRALPNGMRTLADNSSYFVFSALIARLVPEATSASAITLAFTCIYFSVLTGITRGEELLIAREANSGSSETVCRITCSAFKLLSVYFLVFFAVLFLFGGELLTLCSPNGSSFNTERYLELARGLLPLLVLRELFETVALVLSAAYRGLGRTKTLFYIQTVASFVIWVPVAIAVSAFAQSLTGLWYTMVAYLASLSIMLFCKWSGSQESPHPFRP